MASDPPDPPRDPAPPPSEPPPSEPPAPPDPPPPDPGTRAPGWHPARSGTGWWYWDGRSWTEHSGSETRPEHPLQRAVEKGAPAYRRVIEWFDWRIVIQLFGWLAVLILVLVLAVYFATRGDDTEDASGGGTTPAATAETGVPGGSVPGGADGGSEGGGVAGCRPGTYGGVIENATIEGLGAPASVHLSRATLTVADDCLVTADLLWMGLYQSDDWVTANNPSGSDCYLFTGEGGPLLESAEVGPLTMHPAGTDTPGSVEGWLSVSMGDHPHGCPTVGEVGSYTSPTGDVVRFAGQGDGLTARGLTFENQWIKITFDVTFTPRAGG